jgi:hypothetical protein
LIADVLLPKQGRNDNITPYVSCLLTKFTSFVLFDITLEMTTSVGEEEKESSPSVIHLDVGSAGAVDWHVTSCHKGHKSER